LPPEVAQTDALHVVRAIRGRAPRQDAFLILKLATYSSGFAERISHHGERLVRRRLRAINFGNGARASSRGGFTFKLPLGWLRSAIC
jgi:hypothetical protein